MVAIAPSTSPIAIDATRRDAVEDRHLQPMAQEHADERDRQPEQVGDVLQHDAEQRRIVAPPHRSPVARRPHVATELPHPDDERSSVEHRRHREHDVAPRRIEPTMNFVSRSPRSRRAMHGSLFVTRRPSRFTPCVT
jgi:hypothetical protein